MINNQYSANDDCKFIIVISIVINPKMEMVKVVMKMVLIIHMVLLVFVVVVK